MSSCPAASTSSSAAELAAVLGVGIGDKVTVVTPQLNATPVGVMPRLKAFTLVGVFEVGMSDYDRGAGFMHMADAALLMRLGDAAEGVRVKLADMFDAPIVAHELAFDIRARQQAEDPDHRSPTESPTGPRCTAISSRRCVPKSG
jgi:ABC-type lipoprotein release transport system permease subunit